MSEYLRNQKENTSALDQISIDWSDLQGSPEQIEATHQGCEYCEKIWEFGDELIEYLEAQDETSTLLIRDDNGVVGLCLHFVDADNVLINADNLYVTSVEYCPKCGRKL